MAFDLSKITNMLSGKLHESGTKTVVGIDLGASSIKVVQLHEHNGTATLDTYGELQLGPYAGVEIGRVTNLAAPKATEAFVDIVREASVTGKEVSLAIAYTSSFVTVLSVPTQDEEKLEKMIPVEARKYVPVPINEVSLDWFPVSASPNAGSTNVLLAAIHNDALTRHRSIVANAGLNPRFIEIEIFSTIRSVMSQGDTGVAIIDLGAGTTKLYISNQGIVGRSHSLRMSGHELTKTLASAMSIEFADAEELKRQYGLSREGVDPRIAKTFRTVLERGFREIHQVIERYVREEGVAVEKVILTGGGALLSGLESFAADHLQRPVERADPFSKVAYPAFLEDTLKEAGPSFSVALGAALRVLSSE